MQHKLIIRSLNDVQAECICKKWFMSCTGKRKREYIEKEYKKHLLCVDKKYYFEDWRGKNYITLKKASAEWVNSDCPSILDENNNEILHSGGLNGWYKLPIDDLILLKQLRNFIVASDKAFCKKYKDLGYKTGNLVKNIDRELSTDLLQAIS